MFWENLTSADFNDIDRGIPVLLNIAAIEQHGPALPVVTDSAIGWHLCQQVEDRMSDRILILPQIKVCCSEHHMGFPGTLTVSHQTFMNYVSEMLDAVYRHGFRSIFILNSHGGNIAIGNVIKESLGNQYPDLNIAFSTWWTIAKDSLPQLNESGFQGVGHAGEFETSLMMHIAPESIKKDADVSKAGLKKSFPWTESDLLRGAEASLHRNFQEMTANGVFGKAEYASREKGQKIATLVVEKLCLILKDLDGLKR